MYIERLEDGVLVYVMREIHRPGREVYAAALELCHWSHNHAFGVNAAMRGERHLVFAVNLGEGDFSVPVMEQLIQFFARLHEQVLEGAAA